MIYLLVIFVALFVAVLMARIRLRFEIASDKRLLFAGLGETGLEIDFATHRGVIRLFGGSALTFRFHVKGKEVPSKDEKRKPGQRRTQAEKIVRTLRKRRRSVGGWLHILPRSSSALWKYSVGLLRAVTIKQAEGKIKAGFESPDLTGQMFGYYQAALAAAPSLVGRLHFLPDWCGPSFAAEARLAVNLPAYKFAFQTMLLALRLPVRKIIKLAIGTKEGAWDG